MHLSPQPCYFRNHGEENLKLSQAYIESYEQSVVEFWLTSSVLHQEQDYRGEKIWSRSIKRLRGSRLKLTEIRRGVRYMPATVTGCYTWLRFLCEDRQQFKTHQFAITVAPFVWGVTHPIDDRHSRFCGSSRPIKCPTFMVMFHS